LPDETFGVKSDKELHMPSLSMLARAVRAALIVSALFALGGAAAPLAVQAQPSLEVEPASAAPGESVTLRGSGWPGGTTVAARLQEVAAGSAGLSASMGMAFQIEADGTFEVQQTVPLTLFGAGSRGNINAVPGSYAIFVSSGPELQASVPFTVGAPREGALVWGEVRFDSNGNGRMDDTDSTAVAAVRLESADTLGTAISDVRGRYLFVPARPGDYTLRAQVQAPSGTWNASARATLGEGQAVRADLLLVPGELPDPARCFVETGFCVQDDVFWDYFTHRGGVRTLGYPVSRSFLFEGRTTQFFQRLVLQLGADGGVQSLNLLDPGLLPYTHINGSQFPAVDPEVKAATPVVGSPDYDTRIVEFVRQVAPNMLSSGQRVDFFDTFMGTVTCQDAFPDGKCRQDLIPLLNLEIWGAPTSRPTPDPNNAGFIYVRFQRGILHYQGTDARGNPITEGILLADWFKSVITGSNLPPDLEQQARDDDSPYLLQYCPGAERWLCHPERLPNTDLTLAFEPFGG
jgi:hypothetical protein